MSLSEAEENPYTPADALSASPGDLLQPQGQGEAALEALLAEGGSDLSVDRVCKVFPYPLDGFQRKALEAYLKGRSVVVCAPTGAGKTAVAEAAAAATLARGQRVIYTTPLKALSNQKLYEMRKRFGHARCGLQTGDTSLNTEAQIVIMTTEILRNIMYRIAEQQPGSTPASPDSNGSNSNDGSSADSYQGGSGTTQDSSQQQTHSNDGTQQPAEWSNVGGGGGGGGGETDENGSSNSNGPTYTLAAREARLGDVGLIVMDEVHYLGDPTRGTVWEEAIINCPRHIQLLCMSATVKNPDDLGSWISKEHMECDTIKTRFRPVPLHWHHSYTAPPPRGLQLVDLLGRDGRSLNPRLDQKSVMQEEARGIMQRSARRGDFGGYAGDIYPWDKSLTAMLEDDRTMMRKVMSKRVPNMEQLILRLRRNNMLPAIWFILSRKECDLSAVRATSGTLVLTTDTEQEAIREELAVLAAEQPEAVRDKLVAALVRGVASHHAGHLPGWKSLVEKLFQKGLLKIVFATGTLAAGINMPARTTVISALSRMTDEGPQLLPHNELLQMAGRAGRRGYDTEGNCVVLQTRFEGPEEAYSIIKAGPEPLVSHFNASYGLVLNLLSIYSLQEAREFCNRSFGVYLRMEGNTRRQQEVEVLEARAEKLMTEYNASASSATRKLNAEIKDAKDALRAAREAMAAARMSQADEALQQETLPRQVVLSLVVDRKQQSGKRVITLPAVLVTRMVVTEADRSSTGLDPGVYYLGLGADNRLLRVCATHVSGLLGAEQGSITDTDRTIVQSAVESVRSGGWSLLSSGIKTAQAAAGSSGTAVVALQLQRRVKWRMLDTGETLQRLQHDIEAAKQRVNDAMNAMAKVRQETGDWDGAGGGSGDGRSNRRASADKRSADKVAQARALQIQAARLKEEMQAAGSNTWKNFTEVVDVLVTMTALQRDTLKVLPLGLVARSIQGQNELWLALVLTHPVVIGLTGPELAGLLGAILSGEVLKKPGSIWTAYPASDRVVEAVDALEEQRALLSELQADAGLGAWNDALLLDLRLAGVVEAWAAGATWSQIMSDSALDDGDIARLLIRTVDLLKQISWLGDLLPHLKDASMEALRGMERKPIVETLA